MSKTQSRSSLKSNLEVVHVGIGRIYHANDIHVHVYIYVVTYMYKPDSHSIPRSRESKLSITADDNIRDKVFVPIEIVLGYTIVGLIKFYMMIVLSGEEKSSSVM